MVDIKGREDVVSPDGVIDLEPYLRAAERQMSLLSFFPTDLRQPSTVLRTAGSITCSTRASARMYTWWSSLRLAMTMIHGHFVLDLAQEYGLPDR
jgi:hypothetical protein